MDKQKHDDLALYRTIKADAILSFQENELEKALDYIRVAALFAWKSPCGLWYDDELDGLLKQIGMKLVDNSISTLKSEDNDENKNEKDLVFITTAVNVGGHSTLLEQWGKLLKSDFDRQILYVTNSYASKKSYYCTEESFPDLDLIYHNLPFRDTYSNRIIELTRLIEKNSPEFLFLLVDPDDVIAVSVINALRNKPQVIFVNHADHTFWLGRNVIDYLINFRKEGINCSERCRAIKNSFLIPLTTDIKPQESSRREWNMDEDSTISISVGSFTKVLGDRQFNYFQVVENLLEQFPQHHHIFITNPPSDDILNGYRTDDLDINKRFHIIGPFSDLSSFYGVADFLLETFPVGGGMVRLEAMACGLPIVAFHNENLPLLSESGNLPSEYPLVASTSDELIDHCSKLIDNPELIANLGEWLYHHYFQEFRPQKIGDLLKNIVNRNPEPSFVMKEMSKCDYDVEYARSLIKDDFKLHKQLLLQSILKKSSFSLKQRISFYNEGLKAQEFDSYNDKFVYLFRALVSTLEMN